MILEMILLQQTVAFGLRWVLLLIACILFFLAAFNVAAPRVNLIALGLALWTLALLLPAGIG